MKRKAFIVLGSMLWSCMTTTCLGDFGQPVQVSEIFGSDVKGAQNQNLGSVKDLAVDLSNGRIVEVIVGRGGFLGFGTKYTAVPPENFSVNIIGQDRDHLRLGLMAQNIDSAPVFDLSQWDHATAQSSVEQVYQYYGSTPYFLAPEHPAHGVNTVAVPMGEVERASRLIGAQTMNARGEELGRVQNLIVDLPQGRVVEVIFASGSYLGTPGELSAVPPQVMHYDTARNVLTLDVSREALNAAPHFSSRAWPDFNRQQASAVYTAFHVTPYFLSTVNNPSAQVQEPSAADLQITAKIQQELLDTDGLSVDARAVKISTVDGRVTLKGMVDSPEEKRLVGEIAARVVPAASVVNLLEVQETASVNH